jgi:predicted nuclease with TOPRIM domain
LNKTTPLSAIPYTTQVHTHKITALKEHILKKQKQKKYLNGKLANLEGDIEYAQDELDQMQEEYDK